MSRLVIVSNRVAVPGENRAGGLAVGLLAALKERGGLWFGWSGKSVREASGALHEQRDGDIQYVTMDLAKRDVDGYYNGFANRTLWPLLHFRLDLVDYDRGTRETYHRVNELFASKLAPLLREDDIVWIHDYHLIPLGALLRERGLRPQDVRVVPAAAGGPKGLVLGPLDRFIFGDWLAGSSQPVHLVGASIGAWRMATACLDEPVAAFQRRTRRSAPPVSTSRPSGVKARSGTINRSGTISAASFVGCKPKGPWTRSSARSGASATS